MTLESYRTERGIWAACALAAALLAPPAAAQSQDGPLTVRLTSSLAWDDNVFRVPDGAPDPQAAQGKSGKADRINTTSLGLRLDKAYSQQHFLLDFAQTATRYDKFSSLDRDASNYLAQWNWRLSPRISGTLRANRSESQVPFQDTQNQQESNRVVNNYNATVDGELFGGWHLLAGALKTDQKSSQAVAATPDFDETGWELGVRYIAPSQSSLTLTRRTRSGERGLAVAIATDLIVDYTVDESELAVKWIVSGTSTLNGRLTYYDYHYDRVPQRSFSGTGGSLAYAWMPTGRLALNLSATRTINPWTPDLTASYSVEDAFAFAPSWQVGDKTTVRMSASRRVIDYRGAVVPAAGPSRHDVVRGVELAASWLPHRKVTLGASLRRELRTSNDAASEFDDTIAAVSASLAF